MALILVIDEHEAFREAMEYCLPKFGHRALTAADEAEARGIAADHAVDVVLLDLGRPAASGLALCRALRRSVSLARVPVVAMATLATAELEAQTREAGAAELVAKPFPWTHLLGAIARCVAAAGESGGSPDRVFPIAWAENSDQSCPARENTGR